MLRQSVLIGEAANSARKPVRISPIVIGGNERGIMRADIECFVSRSGPVSAWNRSWLSRVPSIQNRSV